MEVGDYTYEITIHSISRKFVVHARVCLINFPRSFWKEPLQWAFDRACFSQNFVVNRSSSGPIT